MVRFGFVTLAVAGLAMVGLDTPPASEPKGFAPAVTYSETIAPILNRSCVKCHQPGGGAPFSLVGFENAKKWIPMITTVTKSGYMPPWKAVKGYGEFFDENRLSDAELAALQSWAAEGAPRGDGATTSTLAAPHNDWPHGKPDLILQIDRPMTVGADVSDVYRSFVLSHKFKKPQWVKAIQVRPSNLAATHHALVFLDSMGAALEKQNATKDGLPGFPDQGGGPGFIPTGFIGTWVPGAEARNAPRGAAFRIGPKDKIVLQVHYHGTGKLETEQMQIGLYYADEPIRKELYMEWVMNNDLRIPANESKVVIDFDHDVRDDMTVHSLLPHMHFLGQEMKAEGRLPDGTVKPLIWVKRWDFRWQPTYHLKKPVKLPKGSVIHVEATYDNSTGNPANPHRPPKLVKKGSKTKDEMFLLIVGHTLDDQKLKG